MPSRTPRASASVLTLMALCFLSMAAAAGALLRGAVIDSENVCISVTVIGPDGGDPGTGCTVVADIPSSGSSSSSSSSSSAASSTSSSSLSSGSSSASSVPFGRYRYSEEYSQWKIARLLRQWARRNTLHTAPGSASSASSSSTWYDESVRRLQEKGYVDRSADLRLNASATRAETAKLISLFSGSVPQPPSTLSFDDAINGMWYVPFIERAAQRNWMFGYDNCYGRHPCIFRPGAIITRAEAAAVFVRVFQLIPSGDAPSFNDVPAYAWYRETIQAAADACIVRGHLGAVRPEDPVTRAELFVMFTRAMDHLRYGIDCVSEEEMDHAAAPASSDDVLCAASAMMCIMDALRADAATVVASLLSLNIRSVTHIPLTEWMLWLPLFILPIALLHLFHKARHQSFPPR